MFAKIEEDNREIEKEEELEERERERYEGVIKGLNEEIIRLN